MKEPNLKVSLITPLILILWLMLNIVIFKDNATGGANQIALLITGLITIFIGVFYLKQPYKELESHMLKTIGLSFQANIILLLVGSLIGLWILAGIVPTMIYYGLELIHPKLFLPISAIICAIISLSTGSSWSTTGTVGIALIGIGQTLSIPEGMVAGAVISGSYFGDKMSPLSDTTNLAPAMAGTDLFTHIRHMLYTTIPSFGIAVILFTLIGLFYQEATFDLAKVKAVQESLQSNFNINLMLLTGPILIITLIYFKIPAIPSMVIGSLIGIVLSLIFQHDFFDIYIKQQSLSSNWYHLIMNVSVNGFKINTGNELINSLLNRGGMSGMLSTIWLIITAMCFGGALEATGMLSSITNAVLTLVKNSFSLIASTIGTCILFNITASDQYLSIVVPGRMFRKFYDDYIVLLCLLAHSIR